MACIEVIYRKLPGGLLLGEARGWPLHYIIDPTMLSYRRHHHSIPLHYSTLIFDGGYHDSICWMTLTGGLGSCFQPVTFPLLLFHLENGSFLVELVLSNLQGGA